ncbi:MAG: polysaccharide deacetylase family protein [Ignavibacteriales bacterium]|nr:polysaccharide deacetylase family protein [Ignavibacteriales bacterium]
MEKKIVNILSFDVEDWYQGFVHRGIDGWQKYGSREISNINTILELLAKYDQSATFFILGSFANKNPEIVKLIHDARHEIASHSYSHVIIPEQTPEQFREDTKKSKDVLNNIIGEEIIGFRAPRWSLGVKYFWALDILAEEGFKYDSSIFPSNIYPFGNSKFSNEPCIVPLKNNRSIIEFPAQVFSVGSIRIPVGGGFFFRALPFWFTKVALLRSNQKFNYGMIYLHPFEFDIQTPIININFAFNRMRYYHLNKTGEYLENVLKEFKFNSINSLFKSEKDYSSFIPLYSRE